MKIAPWNKAGLFLRCWLAPKSTSAMALEEGESHQVYESGNDIGRVQWENYPCKSPFLFHNSFQE